MSPQTQSDARLPLFSGFIAWTRGLSSRFTRSRELRSLDPHELGSIARDLGVTVPELFRLASQGANIEWLLEKRLAEMGLSESLMRARHPKVLRDLDRVCGNCASARRCASDFAHNRSGRSEYCPNTQTLEALQKSAEVDR